MLPSREVLNHSAASEEVRETDNLLVAAAEYTINTQEDQWSEEIAHAHQAKFPEVEHGDFSGGNEEPPLKGVQTHLVDNEVIGPANTPPAVLSAHKASETSSEDTVFT